MTAIDGNVPPLDAEALMAAARAEASLEDFGDEGFVEPMRRWVDSVSREGRLSPMGSIACAMNVQRLLVNRLRLADDLKRHPEIRNEDVSDPIMIIGLPRTGTTKLQRMIATDPGVQSLPLWRLLNPAPLPGWRRGEADARIEIGNMFATMQAEMSPDGMLAHPMGGELPDEEGFLLEMSFESVLGGLTRRAPSYWSWWLNRPRKPPYEYLRLLLQYLQWQDGGRRDRPFVLKSVFHIGSLDVLADVFPQATMVMCHRDPRTSIASTAQLVETWRQMVSDEVEPHDVGAYVLDWLVPAMANSLKQRDALGDKAQFVDAQFADIVSDPMSVIRTIYARRNHTLSPAVEHTMLQWEGDHRNHRTHSYSADRFGFTEAQIDEAFEDYIRRFIQR